MIAFYRVRRPGLLRSTCCQLIHYRVRSDVMCICIRFVIYATDTAGEAEQCQRKGMDDTGLFQTRYERSGIYTHARLSRSYDCH